LSDEAWEREFSAFGRHDEEKSRQQQMRRSDTGAKIDKNNIGTTGLSAVSRRKFGRSRSLQPVRPPGSIRDDDDESWRPLFSHSSSTEHNPFDDDESSLAAGSASEVTANRNAAPLSSDPRVSTENVRRRAGLAQSFNILNGILSTGGPPLSHDDDEDAFEPSSRRPTRQTSRVDSVPASFVPSPEAVLPSSRQILLGTAAMRRRHSVAGNVINEEVAVGDEWSSSVDPASWGFASSDEAQQQHSSSVNAGTGTVKSEVMNSLIEAASSGNDNSGSRLLLRSSSHNSGGRWGGDLGGPSPQLQGGGRIALVTGSRAADEAVAEYQARMDAIRRQTAHSAWASSSSSSQSPPSSDNTRP
jgi:hypothetical protein